jgi:hypothetical protein
MNGEEMHRATTDNALQPSQRLEKRKDDVNPCRSRFMHGLRTRVEMHSRACIVAIFAARSWTRAEVLTCARFRWMAAPL